MHSSSRWTTDTTPPGEQCTQICESPAHERQDRLQYTAPQLARSVITTLSESKYLTLKTLSLSVA